MVAVVVVGREQIFTPITVKAAHNRMDMIGTVLGVVIFNGK